MKIFTNNQIENSKTATRFAQRGKAYSATHVAQNIGAKVGRGLRASKLIIFAKNL